MYFRQAKEGNNNLGLYLLTTLLLMVGYFVGQVPLYIAQSNAIDNHSDIGTAQLAKFEETMDFNILHIDPNVGLFLMFTIFIGATIFFLLAVKYIHKKSIKGLITHRSRINWPKIWYAVIVWTMLLGLMELINYLAHPDDYYLNVNWNNFFWLFIICITVLPIQTTLEELFFRSYLMKGFGLICDKKWMPIVITSILFGLVHGTNPEVAKYGLVPMQIYYISAGLLLGIMTVMDDGLELAIGVHAATNIFGALFVCYDGSVLQTDSIWRVTDINAWMMAGEFIVAGILFLQLSKKMFDWAPWSKLNDKIEH